MQEVKNKTSEYIDTRAITDSIRAELQKSGKVRFAVDAAAMQQQVEELKRQQSELYDKEQAAEKGKMVGAAYRMEGNITSIVKQAKDVKDVYYKFNLQLWNIRNGLLEWTRREGDPQDHDEGLTPGGSAVRIRSSPRKRGSRTVCGPGFPLEPAVDPIGSGNDTHRN